MVKSQALYSFHRTSNKKWFSRPPSKNVAARRAWDYFIKSGPVVWIRLLDGYWGCERGQGGIVEEVDAVSFRRTKKK